METRDADGIRSMFDSISGEYDKLNHILSLGVDRTWRRRALRWITDGDPSSKILDIACGTGDFSLEIAKHSSPTTTVTGLDLSDRMLDVMRRKVELSGLCDRISTEQGNGEQMRFQDNSFDRVTIAFGIRNFQNREKALREILRVLKPGGRLVILELSVPSNALLKWIYCLYFTKILPLIGGIVSGDKAAYRYLPSSVLKFPGKLEWMSTMQECGFKNVVHKAFSLGICRMYIGEKQYERQGLS